MKIEIILVFFLFLILISIQLTLNKILMELRSIRKSKETEALRRDRSSQDSR